MSRRDGSRTSQSVRALLWISAGLVIVGSVIGSPAGTAAATTLAALCALAPVAAGSARLRVVGLIVLAASIALTIAAFPGAKRELRAYRERAVNARPAEPGMPTRSP